MTALVVREAVVNALADSGLADDLSSRSLMLDLIREDLGYPLTIPHHATGRDHLIELVNACAKADGGMNALVHVVRVMRPGSPECDLVRQLVDEPHVHDLLPAPDLARLHEWLTGVPAPRLDSLVRRMSPRPETVIRPADAWEAFSFFADFNAAPGGLPPALALLELVARELDAGKAAELRKWNSNQARRLRLDAELEALRTEEVSPDPANTRLHLMIVVQPDGLAADRYLLSHWRQEDPAEWPPPRGEIRLVSVDELELCVDDLVVEAERAWSEHRGEVALEFVLPRPLLALPVHLWCKERASGYPKPLCFDYPIVIRSLERMTSRQWHRVWHQRWESHMADPSAGRVYFLEAADRGFADPGADDQGEMSAEKAFRLDAVLSDQQWTVMVLASSPPLHPGPDGDALTVALRSGLPALLWHPEASSEALREVVGGFVASGGLGDLPARAQVSRRAAFQQSASPFGTNTARDLVVLWDDPRRLVFLDPAPGHPRPTGGAADERDRAS
ncbi:VMAP-C domain-containing protein [Amycolatopsis sp. H20-H5]|uniref:VMAP-C domain-containing protein n=1 Tax=Amycolatopsis sp. H20-H5 TaxID=3046309 RepID=UPI002DBE93C1|nr:hypothetical protein [Amycolatopsis sp. H20-H5]MEC3977825.1 hypothetical protein [Amycolatopsis sp. H20-H5]